MANQTEMRDHMANMEDQLKWFFITKQQMLAQIEPLSVNPIPVFTPLEIAAPKQMNKVDEDDMPELEDDPPQVIVEKATPNNMLKTEHDKCFVKLEEKVRQM